MKWVMLLGLMFLVSQASAEEATGLKTEKEMVSYAMGVYMAKNLKKDEVEIDQELLMKGLNDGLAGKKLLLPEKELRKVMNSFQADVRRKAAATHQLASVDNKKKGDAFLAGNKSKDDVVTLASGLQYRVLKEGTGQKPTDSDTVECNYRGTLLDGTEFDGTLPGKPADLKVSQLIAGWKEALKLMSAGSKWQLFIPSQLAYGTRGVGSDIGPNETLIFDVELLAVK